MSPNSRRRAAAQRRRTRVDSPHGDDHPHKASVAHPPEDSVHAAGALPDGNALPGDTVPWDVDTSLPPGAALGLWIVGVLAPPALPGLVPRVTALPFALGVVWSLIGLMLLVYIALHAAAGEIRVDRSVMSAVTLLGRREFDLGQLTWVGYRWLVGRGSSLYFLALRDADGRRLVLLSMKGLDAARPAGRLGEVVSQVRRGVRSGRVTPSPRARIGLGLPDAPGRARRRMLAVATGIQFATVITVLLIIAFLLTTAGVALAHDLAYGTTVGPPTGG